MKTTLKTGHFLVFHVVNHAVKTFFQLNVMNIYIDAFWNKSAEKSFRNLVHSRENRFFQFKELAAITHDTVVVENF